MSFRVMSISGFYRNLYSLVVVVLGVLIFSGIFVGHVCVCALLSTWVEPRLLGKVLVLCFLVVLVRFGLGWKGGVGLAVLISEGVFNPSTFCIDAFCSDFVIWLF